MPRGNLGVKGREHREAWLGGGCTSLDGLGFDVSEDPEKERE